MTPPWISMYRHKNETRKHALHAGSNRADIGTAILSASKNVFFSRNGHIWLGRKSVQKWSELFWKSPTRKVQGCGVTSQLLSLHLGRFAGKMGKKEENGRRGEGEGREKRDDRIGDENTGAYWKDR